MRSLVGASQVSLSKAMQERATKKESLPHVATYSAKVANEAQLRRLVSEAITASQWFSVTPLPDDYWEFTVKLENSQLLENWISTHVKNYKDV